MNVDGNTQHTRELDGTKAGGGSPSAGSLSALSASWPPPGQQLPSPQVPATMMLCLISGPKQ